MQNPSGNRRDAGADLHRGSLAPHRVAGPDAEHAGQELADRHAGGDVPAVEPIRRLRLRHAAAANIREDRCQQNAGDDADQGRHQEQTQRPGASPKNRWLVRSIARVKSTAARPARMPMTMERARNSWCSRSLSCWRRDGKATLIAHPAHAGWQ